MATLTLSGPREDVIEQLEDLIDQIKDENNEEPSTAFMPKDSMAPAFYIEYEASVDPASDDDNPRVLYELT